MFSFSSLSPRMTRQTRPNEHKPFSFLISCLIECEIATRKICDDLSSLPHPACTTDWQPLHVDAKRWSQSRTRMCSFLLNNLIKTFLFPFGVALVEWAQLNWKFLVNIFLARQRPSSEWNNFLINWCGGWRPLKSTTQIRLTNRQIVNWVTS